MIVAGTRATLASAVLCFCITCGVHVAEVGKILIVGGGIAGLSLATALSRHGLAPELVERSPAWPAIGAGIALHANAGRMLRTLGPGEAIARSAATLPRWSFHDQRRHGPVSASGGPGSGRRPRPRRGRWPGGPSLQLPVPPSLDVAAARAAGRVPRLSSAAARTRA